MKPKTRSTRRILATLSDPGDRRALLEAAFFLPMVSLTPRTMGWKRVQRLLDRYPSTLARRSPTEARHLAALVEAVARRSPKQYTCLQRSVVLWRVLRRRGLEAELSIGVRKDAAGGHQFHAWI